MYRIEQKIGNNIYVYDVTAYRDFNKRQSRQRRTLIGKRDPNSGEIIPTKGKKFLRKIYHFAPKPLYLYKDYLGSKVNY